MLKKLFYSVLCALLMVSVFTTTSFADTQPEKAKTQVIYKAKELKDGNKLLKKAKNGETDLAEEKLPDFVNAKAILKSNNKDGNRIKKNELKSVEVYTTTQLLKVEKKDGKEVKTYVTNNFAAPTNAQLAAGGSDPEYGYDSSYSVYARSTIYYTISYSGGRKYHDMTRVSGYWDILDNSVTVGGYTVWYAQTGQAKDGDAVTQVSNYKYPGDSFNYYVPSSWEPVWSADQYTKGLGVHMRCYIERRGGQWTFTLWHNF